MNRCSDIILRSTSASLLILTACLLGPAVLPAAAQTLTPQRIPPIATAAKLGMLEVVVPPEVLLDGQPARLAPGARIRDRNNLLVLSGTVIGQKLPVRYTRDSLGLVFEVWVLTAAEVAASESPATPLRPY